MDGWMDGWIYVYMQRERERVDGFMYMYIYRERDLNNKMKLVYDYVVFSRP